MRKLSCVSVFAFISFGFVTAATAGTTYTWSGGSGRFDASGNWTPSPGEGRYPGSGDPSVAGDCGDIATFSRADADYTVTYPAGDLSNIAALRVYATPGHSVVFDGSGTTLTGPALSGGTYAFTAFYSAALTAQGAAKDGARFVRFGSGNAVARGTFASAVATLSSRADGKIGTVFDLTGEIEWTGGQLCLFGSEYGVSSPAYMNNLIYEADRRQEVRIHDGVLSMPSYAIITAFANPTNVLTFDNAACTNNYMGYYSGDSGWWAFLPDAEEGLYELNILNGSRVKTSSAVWGYPNTAFNGTANYFTARRKTFRTTVSGGSDFTMDHFNQATSFPGTYETTVTGAGSFIEITGSGQNCCFGTAEGASARLEILDGALFKVSGGDPLLFGSWTASTVASTYGALVISNATLAVQSAVKLNRGLFEFVDATVLVSGGNSSFMISGGGLEGMDAEFRADGALIDDNTTAGTRSSPIKDFTAAKLGPRGLTLKLGSANGYAAKTVEVSQNFSDWTTDGTLTLRSLTSTRSYSLTGNDSRESNLVLAGGTTKLAAGANHLSHLVVTNGATLSLVGGQTAPTFKSVTLGNATTLGTLALAPGTTVTVQGRLSLERGRIAYSTAPAAGSTQTVFRQQVEPTADERTFWEVFAREAILTGLADAHNRFLVVRDGDEWLYQIVVASARPVRAEAAGWKGPGAAWDAAENWTDSTAPSLTRGAAFAGAEPKTVTVGGAVDAAGFDFAASGYQVTGGLVRLSETTDPSITATGTNEIASALQLLERVPTTVASGGKLTVSGSVTGGGFAKDGAGRLVVENVLNQLFAGWSLAAGWLEFTTPGAFGYRAGMATSVLSGGTLEYAGEAGAGLTPVTIAGPVVAKVESEIALPLVSATDGSLVKRGAGRLVLDLDGNRKLKLVSTVTRGSSGGFAADEQVEYPADGSTPEKRSAITVAEGELVFRGTGETVPTLELDTVGGTGEHITLGAPCAEHSGATAAQPTLVFDHVKYINTVIAGRSVTAANSFVNETRLVITNNAVFEGGYRPNENDSEIRAARVEVDGSSFNSPYNLGGSDVLTHTNYFTFAHDALLRTSSQPICGNVRLDFDASLLMNGTSTSVKPVRSDRTTWRSCNLTLHSWGGDAQKSIRFSFRNGSVCGLGDYEYAWKYYKQPNVLELVFDGSEWWAGDADRTLYAPTFTTYAVTEGAGLVQQPASGYTWTWVRPLVGEGPFVKRGAGTVRFASRVWGEVADTKNPLTLCYSGMTDIQAGTFAIEPGAISNFEGRVFRLAGTLDLEGGSLPAPQLVSAGGSVVNGTCTGTTIGVTVGPGGTVASPLTIAGGVLGGRTTFDFGRAAEDPLPVGAVYTVMRWTGTKPSATGWRCRNLGALRKGVVTVLDNGDVQVRIEGAGMVIMVR